MLKLILTITPILHAHKAIEFERKRVSYLQPKISRSLCPGTQAYGPLGVSLEWWPGPLPRAGGEIISCEWWGRTAKPGRGEKSRSSCSEECARDGPGEEGTRSLPETLMASRASRRPSPLIICIPNTASCTERASTLFGFFSCLFSSNLEGISHQTKVEQKENSSE